MYQVGTIACPWGLAGWFEALGQAWRGEIPRVENAGAPMSRTRREPLQSEVLGNPALEIGWPEVQLVYLDARGHDSVFARVDFCLDYLGLSGPEEASNRLSEIPQGILHARRLASDAGPVGPGRRSTQTPAESLRAALVLGRCSEVLYDADKPVIWTEGRLLRPVHLYRPRSFYDED